jgi:hypothetical protein
MVSSGKGMELEISSVQIEETLSAFKGLEDSEKLQIVKKLLQVLKEKEKEIIDLQEDLKFLSKSKKVEDQLKTLSSLTGLLNLFKDDKEIYEMFEGIFLSLLDSFGTNVLNQFSLT